MRLQRLELFGFKSFADRKVLDFHRPFTGIVGPNGCGKSNVVDAIRWVLGEQRPTSMRGGEMVDVIFKGSVSRPPMSVAEVTMVLDNRAGVLAERGEEVSVTRRVYRSGEGEYLIDGDRVRLKDVRDMLYGTGLGSRGYSVLEQGKIDAVLSADPVERRAIFEEAAGISRYRQRRKETESRLRRVEADLVRLDDVVGELEKRQRSLKIQAGRARRFLEARDAWRIDGLRLARHQVHHLDAQVARAARDLTRDEESAEAHRRRRGAAEQDVVAREREQEALAGEVDRCAAESSDLAGEIRALDERRTQLLARVGAWEDSSREEGGRIEELSSRLDARRGEAEELAARLRELETAASAAQGRERELVGTLRDVRAAHREARATAERQNECVLHLLHERTSGRNRVQHLEEALAPLAERSRRAADRRDETLACAEEARATEAAAREVLAGHEEELGRLEEERAAREAELAQATERRGALEARRAELELEGARLQSRVEALTDWQREREKLEGGARRVLGAIEEGEGPSLTAEIAGLLADHLRTETRYARALDAVLDLRAQALVVGSGADALAIVGWLKEHESGRMHLVVPAGFAARPAVEIDPALLSAPGVQGRLLDVVEGEDAYADLARTLLDDVLLVDDAARALELALEHPRLRFATPDGDVVDAGGLVGGHTETVQGAVGRRSFAAELGGRRADTTRELAQVTAELDGLRAEEARRRAEVEALGARHETESEARARARGAVETALARRTDLEAAVELARHECEELAAEMGRTEEELVAARAHLEDVEARFAVENARLAEVDESRRALESRVDELTRDEAHSRVEATGTGERLEAARRRLVDLGRAVAELEDELGRTRGQCEEHVERAREGREEAERLAVARGELLERRGELEERLGEMRRRERAGREAIEALRRRREAITGELETLLGSLAERRLERQRLELARDEIRRRAEEDFGIEAPALLEGFVPEDALGEEANLEALAAAVGELKARMDKLGPVNLDAVEELEEVSERLEFLHVQRRDVADARRSLAGTIEKLNSESRRLFAETFEAVRGEFRSIFRQLFGGGRADVVLVGSEDVLEAGIEITARPPGRETLPISLLSGGQRTLTALALLFAVFQTRPSPFCVLDEVDAALDDANIGRFLSLLRDSLGETQFVVVTHNKGTMAAGDVLYGVTMAVRGVSHVVGVELSDVDEFVPDATGSVAAAAADEGTGGGNGRSGPEAEPEEDAGDGDGGEPVVELIPRGPGVELGSVRAEP